MKKNPLLLMIIINRFERSCGTFKRREGKNLLLSTTFGQFAPKKKNDHGVDVSIIMVT
jgi:hypothetical protein